MSDVAATGWPLPFRPPVPFAAEWLRSQIGAKY